MERTAEKNTDWKERVRMYWPVLALLAYVGINLFLLSRHENWRDEAQAWQIAKNLGLGGLFAQLRYEGHPCLWYLILMPFAKLGLPFSCMGLISLAFMSVAAWLVLKKAPFSWPVKLVLVFGSFFVYYYPVISRSYSLIPPLLAVLAVLYPCRKEKGILYGAALAALTQTHVYMAGLSFLLSFFWLCETAADLWKQKQPGENKSALAGLGLSLLSGLFLAWELLGSTELNPSIDVHISSSPSYNLYRISVGAQWAVDNALGIGLSDHAWKLVLAAAFVCLLLLLWLSWKEALILAGTWVIQVLMFTYVYLSSEQKAMLLFHELIFVLWLILDKNKGTARKSRRLQLAVWQTALVLLSLTASDGHAQAVLRDVKEPYSAGEAAAAYIRQSVPEDAVLAAASDVAVFSTAAYLPERGIWYPVTGEQITFSVWNEERLETIEYDEMIRRVREQFPEAEDMYLICGGSNNISGLENYLPGLEEMFRQDAMLPEESVVIYYVRF